MTQRTTQILVAENIVRNQPKPIPINWEEAMQMSEALLDQFDIQEKKDA